MADHTVSPYAHPQRLVSDVNTSKPQTKPNPAPSKFLSSFLSKSVLVGILLAILTRSWELVLLLFLGIGFWELVHLLFVGISVFYGLFSRRNVENEKENHSKFDTTQSDMSRIFQVSSVFEDEMENPSCSDENKIKTRTSQYYRCNSTVLVSALDRSVLEEKLNEILVLPPLIPWRSRTGRFELKDDVGGGAPPSYTLLPAVRESEVDRVNSFARRSTIPWSSRPNSTSPLPRKLSPAPSFSSEVQTKNSDDSGKQRSYYKSSPKPPPPLSPPQVLGKSPLMVSSSTPIVDQVSFDEKGYNSTRSFKSELKDFSRNNREDLQPQAKSRHNSFDGSSSLLGKSVRTAPASGSSSGLLNRSGTLSRSGSGVKNPSNSSLGRTRSGEKVGVSDPSVLEEELKETVVLPSPIPWRSMSGRFELKDDVSGGGSGGTPPSYTLPSSVGEPEVNQVEICGRRRQRRRRRRSTIPLSSRPNSTSPLPGKLSPAPSFSSEVQAKNSDDSGKQRSYYKSSPRPPPPLAPPQVLGKSPLMVSSSTPIVDQVSFDEKGYNSTRSFKNELKDFSRNNREDLQPEAKSIHNSFDGSSSLLGKSVRTAPASGSSSGLLNRSGTLSRSGSGVKDPSNSSLGRTRSGEKVGVSDPSVLEEELKETVVLPSPIPWRSMSGRFDLKDDVSGGGSGGTPPSYTLPPSVGEPEVDQVEICGRRRQRRRSTIPLSSRPNSTSPLPGKLSPAPSFSSEVQAKNSDDSGKQRSYYKSSPKPPPPLSPPQVLGKSPLMVSSSTPIVDQVSFEEKGYNSTRSFKNEVKDFSRNNREDLQPEAKSRHNSFDESSSLLGKSVRTAPASGSSSGLLNRSGTLSRSGPGIKNPSNSSLGGTRSGEKMGVLDPVLEKKLKETVVLPSPIPWRSMSGRFELKYDVGGGGSGGTLPSYTLPPSVGESEVDQVESCGQRRQRRRRRRSTIPLSSRPKAGGREVKWIKHYGSSHKILLVGEGDFSFSTCLAKTFGSAHNMVATSLDSELLVIVHYSDASSNINELKSRGCKVMHNIDATKMVRNSSLSQCKFDRIVFNFPYDHDASNKLLNRSMQIVQHRVLVRLFFENAKKLLSVNGEIHVTHKTNSFHCEWDLPECASLSGLRLIEQVDFNLSDYPGYNNKFGLKNGIVIDKPFNCQPSSTFKFGHA